MAQHLSEPKTRVALIEADHVEQGHLVALVSRAEGIELSKVYSDLDGTLADLRTASPDLVVLDLDGLSEFEPDWIRQFHRHVPHTAMLILASETSSDRLLHTLEAGVSGWLQKPCTADQIIDALMVLREGGAVLGNQLARHVLDYFRARGKSVDTLTRREREILNYLVQGETASDIATRLELSKDTIRTHVRNLLVKLKANSRTEAVAKYLNPRFGVPAAEQLRLKWVEE